MIGGEVPPLPESERATPAPQPDHWRSGMSAGPAPRIATMGDDAATAWFSVWSHNQRSLVARVFHSAVEMGLNRAEDVLAVVAFRCRLAVDTPERFPPEVEFCAALLAAMEGEQRFGALRFAACVVRVRQARKQEWRRRRGGSLPPRTAVVDGEEHF